MKPRHNQKTLSQKNTAPTVKDKFGVHFEYHDLCQKLNSVLAQRGFEINREVHTETSAEQHFDIGRRLSTQVGRRRARKTISDVKKLSFPLKSRSRASNPNVNRLISSKKTSSFKPRSKRTISKPKQQHLSYQMEAIPYHATNWLQSNEQEFTHSNLEEWIENDPETLKKYILETVSQIETLQHQLHQISAGSVKGQQQSPEKVFQEGSEEDQSVIVQKLTLQNSELLGMLLMQDKKGQKNTFKFIKSSLEKTKELHKNTAQIDLQLKQLEEEIQSGEIQLRGVKFEEISPIQEEEPAEDFKELEFIHSESQDDLKQENKRLKKKLVDLEANQLLMKQELANIGEPPESKCLKQKIRFQQEEINKIQSQKDVIENRIEKLKSNNLRLTKDMLANQGLKDRIKQLNSGYSSLDRKTQKLKEALHKKDQELKILARDTKIDQYQFLKTIQDLSDQLTSVEQGQIRTHQIYLPPIVQHGFIIQNRHFEQALRNTQTNLNRAHQQIFQLKMSLSEANQNLFERHQISKGQKEEIEGKNKEICELKDIIDKLHQKIGGLESNLKDTEQKKKERELELQELRRSLQGKDEQNSSLQKELDQAMDLITQLQTQNKQIEVLSDQKEELKEKLLKLEKENQQIPTLKKQIEEVNQKISKYESEIQQLQSKMREKEEEIQDLTQNNQNLIQLNKQQKACIEQKEQKLLEKQNKLQKIIVEFEEAKKLLQNTLVVNQKLTDQEESYKKTVQSLQSSQAQHANSMKQMQQKIQQLTTQLQQSSFKNKYLSQELDTTKTLVSNLEIELKQKGNIENTKLNIPDQNKLSAPSKKGKKKSSDNESVSLQASQTKKRKKGDKDEASEAPAKKGKKGKKATKEGDETIPVDSSEISKAPAKKAKKGKKAVPDDASVAPSQISEAPAKKGKKGKKATKEGDETIPVDSSEISKAPAKKAKKGKKAVPDDASVAPSQISEAPAKKAKKGKKAVPDDASVAPSQISEAPAKKGKKGKKAAPDEEAASAKKGKKTKK